MTVSRSIYKKHYLAKLIFEMTLIYYKNTVNFKLPMMIDELDAEIEIRTLKHKKSYSTFHPTKIKYIIKTSGLHAYT